MEGTVLLGVLNQSNPFSKDSFKGFVHLPTPRVASGSAEMRQTPLGYLPILDMSALSDGLEHVLHTSNSVCRFKALKIPQDSGLGSVNQRFLVGLGKQVE